MAFHPGRIAVKNQFPCQTLIACLGPMKGISSVLCMRPLVHARCQRIFESQWTDPPWALDMKGTLAPRGSPVRAGHIVGPKHPQRSGIPSANWLGGWWLCGVLWSCSRRCICPQEHVPRFAVRHQRYVSAEVRSLARCVGVWAHSALVSVDDAPATGRRSGTKSLHPLPHSLVWLSGPCPDFSLSQVS